MSTPVKISKTLTKMASKLHRNGCKWQSLQNLALSKHEPISDGGLGMVKSHSWVLGMVEPEILDDRVHPLPENRSWAAQTPQSRRTASLVPRPKVPAPRPWAPSRHAPPQPPPTPSRSSHPPQPAPSSSTPYHLRCGISSILQKISGLKISSHKVWLWITVNKHININPLTSTL
jgi:hypothetical protein